MPYECWEAAPSYFKVSTYSSAREWRISAVGELDVATAPLLEAAFEEARDGAADVILVDVKRVSFVDPSGLRLLLTMADSCSDQCLRILSAPALDLQAEVAGVRNRLPIAGR
jgi:anti-anti-sigma factor